MNARAKGRKTSKGKGRPEPPARPAWPLADRLRALIVAKGLPSFEEARRRAGLGPATLDTWLAGRQPKLATLQRLLDAIDATYEELEATDPDPAARANPFGRKPSPRNAEGPATP